MEKLKSKESKSIGSVIELMTPELMFKGETGQPYRGTLYVQYVNNGNVLDALSFKKYITALRQETFLFEDLAFSIFTDITKTLFCDVNVFIDLTARGGIQSRTSHRTFQYDEPIKKPLVFQI